MAYDPSEQDPEPDSEPPIPINRDALVAYVEDMLLQLAELASIAGETALAASLALTAIQAGAARAG